jgi:ATP-dependent protease HslVU (ClpYQ) peptidase subunit
MTPNEKCVERSKKVKRMTCIVGYVEPETGVIYMGGDSSCSNDDEMNLKAGSKVVRNGDILIGTCGSRRIGDIFRYVFVPPVYHPGRKKLYAYLIADFIEAMRYALSSGGESTKTLGKGSALLIGLHGRLFQIDEEFQIFEPARGYDAIGSGAYFARGAMYATPDFPPTERIYRALAAAEAHCPSVRGPFLLERLEPLQQEDASKRKWFFSTRAKQ